MNYIKNILNNKKFHILILALIILIGFLLRVYKLYKIDGLWTDEMWSWYVAKDSFPFGVLNKLYVDDFHAPLWFLLLNLWMQIFGDHDLVLRLFSVVFGIVLIPIVYLIGKELSSKKTGIIAALFASINSLLIYYSQEVRFYSFLALLCAISILFLLRIKNNLGYKNFLGLILANIGILYTFDLGIIFVFWEALIFLIYLYSTNKNGIKPFIYSQIITLILYLPYLFVLIHHLNSFTGAIISPFASFKLSFSGILLLFQHWFSPVFVDIANNVDLLGNLHNVFSNNINIIYIIFVLVPIIISFIGIFISISKRNFATIIFLICVLFILTEIILAAKGMLAIKSRYTILIMPILVVIVAQGLVSIKTKLLSIFLISLLIILNLFFLIHSPHSAPKLPRDDQYKMIAGILNKYSLNQEDMLIMTFNGRLLNKYYKKTRVLDLDMGTADTLKEMLNKVLPQEITDSLTQKNSHELLKPFIASSQVSSKFENYLKQETIDNIDDNRYVIIVLAKLYMSYDNKELKLITNNKIYEKSSLYHMLYSRLNQNILKTSYKYLKPVTVEIYGPWEIHILQKSEL